MLPNGEPTPPPLPGSQPAPALPSAPRSGPSFDPWAARFEVVALLLTIGAGGTVLASLFQAVAFRDLDATSLSTFLQIAAGGASPVPAGLLIGAIATLGLSPRRQEGPSRQIANLTSGLALAIAGTIIVLAVIGSEEAMRVAIRGTNQPGFSTVYGPGNAWAQALARLAACVPSALIAVFTIWLALAQMQRLSRPTSQPQPPAGAV